ncbi:uncharacterized protein LOC100193884 isoform 1 [Zea mays]|uniref:Uncharacterized protein n=1 Tax=Zea mays TaxID=4577 RepID=C0PMM9_MAIZE|nr:uncharacterized protein LOC100193884 isoform 1 [Zea mays]ACN36445.1 unknown [Zea mays]ONM63040.1 hypothetical protein ZEAMMB73_Zm00001d000009 [Zea mays]|eukprot:NP_001170272.1 uncharacterized protein LOC100193884 isoform 1 [Zea mays]
MEQQMVPLCVKSVKRKRKRVDHSNIILALPAIYPFPQKKTVASAAGKKRAATKKNTTGRNKTRNKAARAPKQGLRKGKRKNAKAAHAPNDDALTEGRIGSVDISNGASNEHPVQEDQKDLIRQQHNFSNTGDDIIVDDRSGDANEPKIVSNEQYISDEEAGTVQLPNPAKQDILEADSAVEQPYVINNEQQIMEEQPGVENQQNVAVNQQHKPDEQAGIMQEQNIGNALEENVPEDPTVFADIFNFPLNNELMDLSNIEDNLEDSTGVQDEQTIMNNQQLIPDQQAGLVHQQNPENAIEKVVAEDDPAVLGDIFSFPLSNQLMDLD